MTLVLSGQTDSFNEELDWLHSVLSFIFFSFFHRHHKIFQFGSKQNRIQGNEGNVTEPGRIHNRTARMDGYGICNHLSSRRHGPHKRVGSMNTVKWHSIARLQRDCFHHKATTDCHPVLSTSLTVGLAHPNPARTTLSIYPRSPAFPHTLKYTYDGWIPSIQIEGLVTLW